MPVSTECAAALLSFRYPSPSIYATVQSFPDKPLVTVTSVEVAN